MKINCFVIILTQCLGCRVFQNICRMRTNLCYFVNSPSAYLCGDDNSKLFTDTYSPLGLFLRIDFTRLLMTLHLNLTALVYILYHNVHNVNIQSALKQQDNASWNQNGQQIHVPYTCTTKEASQKGKSLSSLAILKQYSSMRDGRGY